MPLRAPIYRGPHSFWSGSVLVSLIRELGTHESQTAAPSQFALKAFDAAAEPSVTPGSIGRHVRLIENYPGADPFGMAKQRGRAHLGRAELRVEVHNGKHDADREDVDAWILCSKGQHPGYSVTRLFGEEVFPVCSPQFRRTLSAQPGADEAHEARKVAAAGLTETSFQYTDHRRLAPDWQRVEGVLVPLCQVTVFAGTFWIWRSGKVAWKRNNKLVGLSDLWKTSTSLRLPKSSTGSPWMMLRCAWG